MYKKIKGKTIKYADNYKALFGKGRGVRRLNFICINCRRSKKATGEAICSECGKPMHNAGERIKIPPRHDKKGWLALRKFLNKILLTRTNKRSNLRIVL